MECLFVQRLVDVRKYRVVLQHVVGAYLPAGFVMETTTVATTATNSHNCVVGNNNNNNNNNKNNNNNNSDRA